MLYHLWLIILQFCDSNNYSVFSFIECKLALISFTKEIVNASLFFQKNLLQYIINCCQL